MNAVPAQDWRYAEKRAAARAAGVPDEPGGAAVEALITVRRATSKLSWLNRQLAGKTAFSLEDLAEQALYIDEEASASLDLLWRLCIASGDDATADQYSGNARRFGVELSELYLSCIRQFANGTPAPGLRRTLLFVRTMHAIRTLFQWQWLRYETPAARYWNAAADVEEFAARESRHRVTQRLYRSTAVDACVSSEHYAMRFMHWLGPSSLTPDGLDALVRAAAGTLESIPRDARCDGLSGWIVQLQRRMREWPRQAPGQSELTLPLGKNTRFEGAGAGAVAMQRTASFLCGFAAVATQAVRPAAQGKPEWRGQAGTLHPPCVIRAMSSEGWHMHVRSGCRGGLRVGALVALPPVPSSPSLGIVRWLERAEDGSWEAGVEALNDRFSGFFASGPDAAHAAVPVLVACAQRLAERRTVTAILPGGWFGKARALRLQSPAVALDMSALIEAGADFDIVAMQPAGDAGTS